MNVVARYIESIESYGTRSGGDYPTKVYINVIGGARTRKTAIINCGKVHLQRLVTQYIKHYI